MSELSAFKAQVIQEKASATLASTYAAEAQGDPNPAKDSQAAAKWAHAHDLAVTIGETLANFPQWDSYDTNKTLVPNLPTGSPAERAVYYAARAKSSAEAAAQKQAIADYLAKLGQGAAPQAPTRGWVPGLGRPPGSETTETVAPLVLVAALVLAYLGWRVIR